MNSDKQYEVTQVEWLVLDYHSNRRGFESWWFSIGLATVSKLRQLFALRCSCLLPHSQ